MTSKADRRLLEVATENGRTTPSSHVNLTQREAEALLLPAGTRIRLISNGCTGRIYSRSWPTDPTPYCCFVDAKPHSEQMWLARDEFAVIDKAGR